MRTTSLPPKPYFVFHVEGNLESENLTRFRASVAALRAGHDVVFDLRDVAFVDSAGLGALIGAVRRVRENGGDAVICRPRPSVRRALHLTAIDRSVSVVGSFAEAELSFLGRAAAA
jgi:anti-sigma B factor antagonist